VLHRIVIQFRVGTVFALDWVSNIAKLPKLLGKALPDDAVNNLSDERHDAEDTTPE
jgi:hypothetical protein